MQLFPFERKQREFPAYGVSVCIVQLIVSVAAPRRLNNGIQTRHIAQRTFKTYIDTGFYQTGAYADDSFL